MVKPNPHRPFVPDPAQMALAPNVSGNAVNGLGESRQRPPRVVYWAPDPSSIAHGRMQQWFYQVRPDDPHIVAARADRASRTATPLPEVEGAPVTRTPEAWTSALRGLAGEADFDACGVAVMDPTWVYEGQVANQSRVLMLAVQHDYDAIATAPHSAAGGEVVRQYGRAMAAAKAVAAWLRRQGWAAEPVTGPMATTITMIPPAIAAGLGELGKHGSLINADFGASFRLSAVLTDAPFAATPPKSFGVDDFCLHCRVCEAACPPEALAAEKKMVRGTEKWYVDFDRCLPFFNQHHGCAICIAVCPWSRPGVGHNLAAKFARRAARL